MDTGPSLPYSSRLCPHGETPGSPRDVCLKPVSGGLGGMLGLSTPSHHRSAHPSVVHGL